MFSSKVIKSSSSSETCTAMKYKTQLCAGDIVHGTIYQGDEYFIPEYQICINAEVGPYQSNKPNNVFKPFHLLMNSIDDGDVKDVENLLTEVQLDRGLVEQMSKIANMKKEIIKLEKSLDANKAYKELFSPNADKQFGFSSLK